jgi:AcrR family transcriptional regulator
LKRKGAEYHHGDLRRALVEATLRLVAEHGLDGFTLRAAAKLAGVSDGAPYHHFTDREALLAAVAEESFGLLSDEMTSAADDYAGSGREKAQAMGVAYVLFAAKYPSRFRIMFGSLSRGRTKHPDLFEASERVHRLVRQALARALSDEPKRTPSKKAVVRAWALLHGLSALAVDGYLGADGKRAPKLERLAWEAIQSLDRPERREPESIPRSGARSRTSRAPLSARRNAS